MSSSNWENKFVDIKTRNLHFLNNKILTDCKFSVQDEIGWEIISAHKIILASASPVFEKMFCGKSAEKCDTIRVTDIQPDTFKTMLEYIYTDRLNSRLSLKKTFELGYAAHKYNLFGLQQKCTEVLLSQLRVDNACFCYEFATIFEWETLEKMSLQFIIKNTSDILKQPNFTEISMFTLMTILDQKQLNISTELELFNAVLRFGNKRVKFGEANRNGQITIDDITPDAYQDFICKIPEDNQNNSSVQNGMGNDDETTHFVKEETFKEAVRKIRFLTMTPEEFAEGPATSKLLTSDDIISLFVLVTNPSNTQTSVPKGFQNTREKRNAPNNFN